ncbi:CDK-activating kinase assembly factor MAT1 [Trichinella zimbabwensis]|uniref:CDK-activating kinase assembly factor MAT1 n=1 Tax=Trichinella zimbabwensis TaxID=268475 RepID=A0A0V1HBW8_9BILA|nr:CDK-activating kinase assembly factor MAT1 [Trichinella zimbabwensis]
MSGEISRLACLALYKNLQFTAKSISNYSYRQFFVRRIRDHFRANIHESDLNKRQALFRKGEAALEVLKRQKVLCDLYPSGKLVIEEHNKNFKLMISECGHMLCQVCVDVLFVRHSAVCPQCGQLLKRSSFWEMIYDDPLVEKEIFHRKRLQRIYNLKEDDFPDLRSYNDYLEQFEEIVFNMVFDRNLEQTKQMVADFAKANEDLIAKNRNRLSKDQEWVQRAIDDQEKMRSRLLEYKQQEQQEAGMNSAAKRADAREILNELMNSDTPAEMIIMNKKHQQMVEDAQLAKANQAGVVESKPFMFQSQEKSGAYSALNIDGVRYDYIAETLVPNIDVDFANNDQLQKRKFYLNARMPSPDKLAGGFSVMLPLGRAVQEAFCDVLFNCDA